MVERYLPAILPTTLTDAWGLRPPNWMDPRTRETGGYYPHALLSYYHWKQTTIDFPEEAFIFGDSGGYSIMTLGAAIDPMDVVRWQERNCTVGVVLDVPPWDKKRRFQWHRGLNGTVRNTEQGLPVYENLRRDGTNFRWWGVCHGGGLEQLNTWWDAMEKVYPFTDEGEGWAFKPLPNMDPEHVARTMRFIQQKGVKRAHMLMTTGASAVATMLCLGHQSDLELLTYDSSSASAAGINRSVYVFTEDGFHVQALAEKFRETGGEDRAVRDFLMTCDCQSCEWLRMDLDEYPTKVNDEYWKYRMIYHNLLTSVELYRRLAEAAEEDPEGFLAYMLNKNQSGSDYWKVQKAFHSHSSVVVPTSSPRSLLDSL